MGNLLDKIEVDDIVDYNGDYYEVIGIVTYHSTYEVVYTLRNVFNKSDVLDVGWKDLNPVKRDIEPFSYFEAKEALVGV